jgi:hypothetical protein
MACTTNSVEQPFTELLQDLSIVSEIGRFNYAYHRYMLSYTTWSDPQPILCDTQNLVAEPALSYHVSQ